MVEGIGIDIIEIERIQRSIDTYGERFLNKVFTQTEIDYCLNKKNKYQHFAARFAAKEAVYKAISSGKSTGVNWKDIEIYNEFNGMPSVKLYGELEELVGNDRSLKVTISHSQNYVTCFAIFYLNLKS